MGRKRKKTKKGRNRSGVNAGKIKSDILAFLNAHLDRAYSPKQIARKLGYRDKVSNNAIPRLVHELESDNKILKVRNGSFKSKKEPKEVTGIVDHVSQRYAYITETGMDTDVWVKTEHLQFAMDGDQVQVMIYGKRHGPRPEGKVTKILSRNRTELVGRVELAPNYAFVIPDNRRIHEDIFVPPENLKKAKHNDKVIVKILDWPTRDRSAKGKVTKVLGAAGENEAEIHSIMAEFGLPFEFPPKVLKASESIESSISKEELKKRRDFRDVLTFTIDPEDAKDFDDALSYQELDNGNIELGVHIADVTHYLEEDSVLDKEAISRATSVYLVDRTIPMLPERLSNDLCSLNPNQDKLTFSAVFEIDDKANIISEWYGRAIIHSDRRFTYEEAQKRIETQGGDLADELVKLNQLAKDLRKQRFDKGAINFETVEVKFDLDSHGKPLGVVPKVRKDAHKLVEEFMLLANKKVAEFIYKQKQGKQKNTFVYRVHDYPDPEKLQAFSVFAMRFGHDFQMASGSISSSLNKLMDDIEGKPEQNVLESLAIRAMSKASYTTESKGHFGLAFEHYTHFTSPIRRYPDVMVHRLLDHYLQRGKSPDREPYEEKCVHSSEREKRAADAERASIKYKQVEFMQNAEDKDYEGIVSGVTEWGIFVEMTETKCEGMIRLADLTGDYYEFDEQNLRVVGLKNKRIISLGDPLTVRVKKTDIDRRTIDLELVDEE